LIDKLASQPQIEHVERESKTRIIAILEYKIGVSELSKENRAKLKVAAEIIKSNPEYTFEVCGYADNETGSKDINTRLRNARANRAIDQLLHYGVNRNQLLKSTNDGELPGTTTRAIIIRLLDCD
jgi:outer membrane protein OmpA-like peptidoglycan-associated protein